MIAYIGQVDAQCINTALYPSGTITAPSGVGVTPINGCNYTNEYSNINGIVNGSTYELKCVEGAIEKYVTISDDMDNIIASGMSPFSWTANLDGAIRAHWTDDAACASTNNCHVTSIECTSCMPLPPPAEDVCMGAINIPVAVGACTGLTTGNNTGSTDSDNDVPPPPAATCSSYSGGDIWFTVTVPMSGNVTISGGPSPDCCSYLWYELYEGVDCSALSSFQCSSTNGNDPSQFETELGGRTPGETIWIRAWDSSNDNGPGDFNFCAFESICAGPSVSFNALDNSNCPSTMSVVWNMDNMGDASSYTIAAVDNTTGMPAGMGGPITGTGPFTVSNIPVPQTDWSVILIHDGNPMCNDTLGPFNLYCPPVEDNCIGAIDIPVAMETCSGFTVGQNNYATDSDNDVPPPPAATCSSYSGGDIWFKVTVPMSGSVTISGGPSPDCCSYLWYELYDGVDCSALTSFMCSSTNGNDPSQFETALTGRTPGETIWIRAWDSSNDNGPGDFNLCAFDPPSCLPPTTLLEMNITSTTADLEWTAGDMEQMWNLEWGPAGFTQGSGTMVNGLMTAVYNLTGLTEETDYDWYVQADCGTDVSPWIKGEFTTLAPPPANDLMCNAIDVIVDAAPITGDNSASTGETEEPNGFCWFGTGTMESVWYKFEAPASGKVTVSTDFDTPLNDTHIAVYEAPTACDDMATLGMELGCSEDEGDTGVGYNSTVDITGLQMAVTYYIQVDGYGTAKGEFMIEVKEKQVNDACADAVDLAMGSSEMLMNQSFAGATDADDGGGAQDDAASCEAAASIDQNDVWYKVGTDNNGGDLEITVTPGAGSDVAIELYDGCGSMAMQVACADNMGIGMAENFSAAVNLKDTKGGSSSRTADYYVRVYEKSASGSTFTIAAEGTALPIVLSSFSAKAQRRGNNIQWSTLSEVNSDFIEVLSSSDANRWEKIATVNTKGESSTRQDYSFLDKNPFSVTYYKLNAVDNDGRNEFSEIVKVERSVRAGKMVVSPNPTANDIVVQVESTTDNSGTIRVVDMTGIVVIEQKINLNKGLNTIDISLRDLASGIYMLSMSSDDEVQIQKIIKH